MAECPATLTTVSMFEQQEELQRRAEEYALLYELTISQQLGYGNQGTVSETIEKSAIKVYSRQSHYHRERDVYRRLLAKSVFDIRGCAVPQLLNYNDHLWVVEMSIVRPPFVLDFASAYLDVPPEYPAETVAERAALNAELFGPDWPEVELVIAAFERYGIYLVDVHPGNIRLSP